MEFKVRIYQFLVYGCCVLFLIVGCSDNNNSSESQKQTYQRQVKAIDEQQGERAQLSKVRSRQQKKFTDIIAKLQEDQTETTRRIAMYAKQLEKAEIQQKRMEKLLLRWEKQADRYDSILDKWEKK